MKNQTFYVSKEKKRRTHSKHADSRKCLSLTDLEKLVLPLVIK